MSSPWENRQKWTLGVLSHPETDEVPGTILLLSSNRNQPLGLRNQPAQTSASSFPSPYPPSRSPSRPATKKTPDGRIVLHPQPEESMNDPLNWPSWRRDAALLSLGFYCLLGGGMTPVLAAGFNAVATDYNVSTQQVAYTTGLYMTGLGIGMVCALPKLSESGPSSDLYGHRVVGASLVLLFLFVPETFWDRTPRPKLKSKRPGFYRNVSELAHSGLWRGRHPERRSGDKGSSPQSPDGAQHPTSEKPERPRRDVRVGFAEEALNEKAQQTLDKEDPSELATVAVDQANVSSDAAQFKSTDTANPDDIRYLSPDAANTTLGRLEDGPEVIETGRRSSDVVDVVDVEALHASTRSPVRYESEEHVPMNPSALYTHNLRERPRLPYLQTLRPWNGRLSHDKWLRVAARPFILFAHPAVLWSALVYSLSIGWLIVLSESVATIYENKASYNFSALGTGLIYISPFIGGILGTAVAGRVSDIIVQYMTRRNGGIYEPEFRLVMAIPIAITTTIGLMGFGWSAQERDAWIVPTVFFGIVSFGCSLGSTTSITFCVDSYRQYAGEALVTLNFSKNIFHGLVFSLFIVDWLQSDGARTVFIAIGGIQLACLLTSIPMYIYGKRARMWTVQKKLMEKV
ncbi:hypothetical protein UA08_01888 [Talaromyces atroroseus]|uniref:Major facilitator superfamily (MFS) profile domain-containing protein n=1 Tax=Talaromyces atroroseus TaxID=1441469 RepID=A0A1Q5QB75_TALAT|nr:hypothetical protein UA08_01888 [Talaromyces atroroseus]OKL63193.1 hypothetical protein UA08_01888 [Talaromyces atroroseus]